MGTRSLSGIKITLGLSATAQNDLGDSNSTSASASVTDRHNDSLTSGVDAGQANRIWLFEGSISSGSSQVIDLYDMAGLDAGAGEGNDPIGQPMSPIEEIVAIKITNRSAVTSTGILEIEPDSTNGWTPIGTHTAATGGGLRGGGVMVKYQPAEAGFVVTDASSHRLKLTANTADVDYRVTILGRHDDEASSSSSSSFSSSSSSSSSTPSSSQSSSSSSSASSQSSSSSTSSS